MKGRSQKRRKMRPDNPITKVRATSKPKVRKEATSNDENFPKVIPNQQPTTNTIKRKRKPISKKPVAKQYSSASDSDETDKESTPPAKEPPAKEPSVEKSPTPKRPAKRKRLTKKDFSDIATENDSGATLKIRRKPTPVTTADNSSASDSDETEDEQSTSTTPEKSTFLQKVLNRETSASDSDETDLETTTTKNSKPGSSSAASDTNDNELSPSEYRELSASDSDETDKEQPETPKAKPATTTQQKPAGKSNTRRRTTMFIEDSDDPESGVSEEEEEETEEETEETGKTKEDSVFRETVTTKNHLKTDRISFRKKHSYDASKDAAFNLRQRFNDLFIPNVSSSEFISDSDSDSSDSGEDYENRYYEPWQRTLGHNRHPERGEWPKSVKLGYSDKLKLEKRIKKICRRENMTFNQAREIFSNRKEGQLRFFQKIGKAFPQIPLYRLTKLCKEMYHVKRNNSPWTPEEIAQLEDLVKLYGRVPEKIAEHMNRSPKNISDFFFGRWQKTSKANKRWTKEEDEKLAKAIAEQRKGNPDKKISYVEIEPLFKGERSQLQIYGRAAHIKHRIQPDGTLVDNRKATLQEELQYLEKLMEQVDENDLKEESQLNLTKDRGFVAQSFYLRRRNKIENFETMHIRDILNKLIKQQKKMIAEQK